MRCGPVKVRKSILWSHPPIGLFKFNVNGAARRKPRLAVIGGMLRNCNRDVLFIFSKYVGVCDSNLLSVFRNTNMAILLWRVILRMQSVGFRTSQKAYPCKFQFLFTDSQVLSTTINVSFQHKSRSLNMMADALTKQGVERISSCEGFIM